MPSFKYDGYIDIDPEEYLSNCDSSEIDELIELLVEEEYIRPDQKLDGVSRGSVSEQIFEESLDKLHGNWNMLTPEEESIILNIAKRF